MSRPDLDEQWLDAWKDANMRYLTTLNAGLEPWNDATSDTGKDEGQ